MKGKRGKSRAESMGPTGAYARIKRNRLPSDIADAAEVALDDIVAEEEAHTHDATSRFPSVDDSLAPLPSLRFAIYEDASLLDAAQSAIMACGHTITIAAATPEPVIDAIRNDSIDVLLVSLPGGEPVVAVARSLEPRRPVLVGSFAGDRAQAVRRAYASGVDLATTRPHDGERIAPVLLAALRLHDERRSANAARGSEAVLRARLDELADIEPRGLLPFEVFQRVLELEIKRAKRYEYPLSVALFAVEVDPPPPPAGIRGILRARAGNVLIHAIRDIDIATQLDHERFLVLLPYTDLKGSAGLGRRVIAAVAAGDPVVAAGRTFPPRVVGAVAGARPGQPVSFAKLVKDATQALEQARRDGAELAVQP